MRRVLATHILFEIHDDKFFENGYPPLYSDDEFELLTQDKLWVMCQTSKYGDPNIYKLNRWRSDGETIGYTEYFCGAECTGTIERSKVIMYGSRNDLCKKLEEYKQMCELIENAKSQYEKGV